MASRILDKSEYGNYICDHLMPVLQQLKAVYGIGIAKAVLDMKSCCVDIQLTAPLPEQSVAFWRRAFDADSKMVVSSSSIVCRADYCAIEAPPP